mgnify:CR=1 FL=1
MEKSKFNRCLFLTAEIAIAITGVIISLYEYLKKKKKKETTKKLSEEEKRIIAYHEAGHVVAAQYLKTLDDLEFVTIIPGEDFDGYTYVDIQDKSNIIKTEWEEYLMYVLGGRVAEKVIFGEVSTASGKDLKRATDIASAMVMSFGMDDEIGPISFVVDNGQEMNFLGTEIFDKADFRIQTLLKELEERTIKLLTDKKTLLERIANELLRKEILFGEDVKIIIEEMKE